MFSSGCASQLTAVLDESQKEVEGSASFVNKDSLNTLKVAGTRLKHQSPSFQWGPRASLERQSADGASALLFQAGAEARYNLSTEGDILPFFGGSFGFINTAIDSGSGFTTGDTGFAWALNGGFRVPVTPGGFLVTKIEWENISISDFDQDSFGVFTGFAVRY